MRERVDKKWKMKEIKINPLALKTRGAAEWMGERQGVIQCLVGTQSEWEGWGGVAESGNCSRAEDPTPPRSKREMKACDRLLPPPLPPPTISSEFCGLLRNCGATSSR